MSLGTEDTIADLQQIQELMYKRILTKEDQQNRQALWEATKVFVGAKLPLGCTAEDLKTEIVDTLFGTYMLPVKDTIGKKTLTPAESPLPTFRSMIKEGLKIVIDVCDDPEVELISYNKKTKTMIIHPFKNSLKVFVTSQIRNGKEHHIRFNNLQDAPEYGAYGRLFKYYPFVGKYKEEDAQFFYHFRKWIEGIKPEWDAEYRDSVTKQEIAMSSDVASGKEYVEANQFAETIETKIKKLMPRIKLSHAFKATSLPGCTADELRRAVAEYFAHYIAYHPGIKGNAFTSVTIVVDDKPSSHNPEAKRQEPDPLTADYHFSSNTLTLNPNHGDMGAFLKLNQPYNEAFGNKILSAYKSLPLTLVQENLGIMDHENNNSRATRDGGGRVARDEQGRIIRTNYGSGFYHSGLFNKISNLSKFSKAEQFSKLAWLIRVHDFYEFEYPRLTSEKRLDQMFSSAVEPFAQFLYIDKDVLADDRAKDYLKEKGLSVEDALSDPIVRKSLDVNEDGLKSYTPEEKIYVLLHCAETLAGEAAIDRIVQVLNLDFNQLYYANNKLLTVFARENNLGLVKVALKHGAIQKNEKAIRFAIANGNVEIFRLLKPHVSMEMLKKALSWNVQYDLGPTFGLSGSIEMMKELMSLGFEEDMIRLAITAPRMPDFADNDATAAARLTKSKFDQFLNNFKLLHIAGAKFTSKHVVDALMLKHEEATRMVLGFADKTGVLSDFEGYTPESAMEDAEAVYKKKRESHGWTQAQYDALAQLLMAEYYKTDRELGTSLETASKDARKFDDVLKSFSIRTYEVNPFTAPGEESEIMSVPTYTTTAKRPGPGRNLLSIEDEEPQFTSKASNLSPFAGARESMNTLIQNLMHLGYSFFSSAIKYSTHRPTAESSAKPSANSSAINTLKHHPLVTVNAPSRSSSKPAIRCRPIAYHSEQFGGVHDAIHCTSNIDSNIAGLIFPKIGDALVTSGASRVNAPNLPTHDTYNSSTCKAVTFHGRASIYCEGENTHGIFTSSLKPPLDFDGSISLYTFALCGVLYGAKKLGKKALDAIFLMPEALGSDIYGESTITRKMVDAEVQQATQLLVTAKKEIEKLPNGDDKTAWLWAWHEQADQLQMHRKDFERSSCCDNLDPLAAALNELRENILQYQVELQQELAPKEMSSNKVKPLLHMSNPVTGAPRYDVTSHDVVEVQNTSVSKRVEQISSDCVHVYHV